MGCMTAPGHVVPTTASAAPVGPVERHVIEVGRVRPAIVNGLRLLLETVVVPTLLLYVCMLTVGEVAGLVAVLGWCAFTVAIRISTVRRVPRTLLLVIAMLVVRTAISLAVSSVYVFLLQPVAGSLLMAVIFIGSALLGRPVTMRLAQDFVHLPARLCADHRVRQMFVEVSVLWGVSRLLDAGMSFGALHWGLAAGLFSRGAITVVLTALSIAACAYWGSRRLRRIEGIEFRFGKAEPAPAVAGV